MSADFARTLGAITPEYAEAAGGEVTHDHAGPDWRCEACKPLADVLRARMRWASVHWGDLHDDAYPSLARAIYESDWYAATRATAADTVLTEARRLCCGDNPAPEHNARADHSQRMAFAEELARAVRGS